MRGSPSCQFTVTRFGAWRAAVAMLAAASLSCLIAWVLTAPQAEGIGARLAVGAAATAVLLLASALWRQRPRTLHWNGSAWSSLDAGGAGNEVTGRVQPMVDLGSFLLLRFRPDGRRATSFSATWIPVGRRGLEREWHAIRCAVHGPASAGAVPRASFP